MCYCVYLAVSVGTVLRFATRLTLMQQTNALSSYHATYLMFTWPAWHELVTSLTVPRCMFKPYETHAVARPSASQTSILSKDCTHLNSQVPAAWKMVQVQNCTTGQVQQNAAICSTCPAATFSLNPLNGSCDACPAGATCFGGSHFIPPSQSWHSHPYSTNIVQCPNAKACQGDRTTLLNCKEVNFLVPTNLGFPFQSFTMTVASCAHWH